LKPRKVRQRLQRFRDQRQIPGCFFVRILCTKKQTARIFVSAVLLIVAAAAGVVKNRSGGANFPIGFFIKRNLLIAEQWRNVGGSSRGA